MHDATSNSPLQQLVELVRRHKAVIVLCPLVCFLLGALFFLCWPRTYRSEARLFLRIGRESVGIDPTATTGKTLPLYTDRKDEVESAQEVFRSRCVASQVVDQLGTDVVLGRDSSQGGGSSAGSFLVRPFAAMVRMVKNIDPISEREEAIIEVERNLTVKGDRQSTVFTVEYAADSPQLAQTICQAVVETAQREHMRIHRSEASSPFFTEQQQLLREQLEKSLEALRGAKDEMGLADVVQRRTTLEKQFNAIELDRLKSNQQLATSQARIEDLEQQLAEIPERSLAAKKNMPNQGADLLRDRLYELQVKSMDLGARYSDDHPLVRAVHDQLEEAEKVLREQAEQRTETTDEVNPIYRELSLALKQEHSVVAGLRSRVAELDRQKSDVLASLRAVNQQDLKIDGLTRDVELARGKFMQYARTREEARIDKELQLDGVSNISVVQPATLAEKPVIPARGITAAGTLLLATCITVGLVVLGERQPGPAPVMVERRAAELPRPRRRLRREAMSRKNGQSEVEEICSLPK